MSSHSTASLGVQNSTAATKRMAYSMILPAMPKRSALAIRSIMAGEPDLEAAEASSGTSSQTETHLKKQDSVNDVSENGAEESFHTANESAPVLCTAGQDTGPDLDDNDQLDQMSSTMVDHTHNFGNGSDKDIEDLNNAVYRMQMQQPSKPFVPACGQGGSTGASSQLPNMLMPSSGEISTGASSIDEQATESSDQALSEKHGNHSTNLTPSATISRNSDDSDLHKRSVLSSPGSESASPQSAFLQESAEEARERSETVTPKAGKGRKHKQRNVAGRSRSSLAESKEGMVAKAGDTTALSSLPSRPENSMMILERRMTTKRFQRDEDPLPMLLEALSQPRARGFLLQSESELIGFLQSGQ